VNGPVLIQIGGAALVGLALARGLGLATEALLRARRQSRARALEIEELLQRVALARARREAAEQVQTAWNGWRKFEVARCADEAEGIRSFYLRPHDGKPLPGFLPGQYLTLQFAVPGQPRPVVRCYSLSDAPHPDHYRITVKRVPPPPDRKGAAGGLVSNHLHRAVHVGSILDVRAPAGQFVVDPLADRPLVLIGGGVGITPLWCMLSALAARGAARETWLFYGVRHGGELVAGDDLRRLAREQSGFRLQLCFSDPRPEEAAGRDYDEHGRVTVELLRGRLPSNNYDFYLCGPPPMMGALRDGLRGWGVPDEHVHFELFGPASVKRTAGEVTPAAEALEVVFERSGKRCSWTPAAGTLLELAEANGVAIDCGCRAGNCGTCLVAVREGTVDYATPPGFAVERGSCLTCVARPAGRVVLDA